MVIAEDASKEIVAGQGRRCVSPFTAANLYSHSYLASHLRTIVWMGTPREASSNLLNTSWYRLVRVAIGYRRAEALSVPCCQLNVTWPLECHGR